MANRPLATINMPGLQSARITQADDGEVIVALSGFEVFRTHNIDEAGAFVAGLIFSDHYGAQAPKPAIDLTPRLFSALGSVSEEVGVPASAKVETRIGVFTGA